MLKLQELDEVVSIRDQLRDDSKEPVVLVNVFHVAPEQTDALIAAWADDARYFKAQAGFISTQLHRGIGGSGAFLNYAVWESVSAFRAAFASPTFQAKLAGYPGQRNRVPVSFSQIGRGRPLRRLSSPAGLTGRWTASARLVIVPREMWRTPPCGAVRKRREIDP